MSGVKEIPGLDGRRNAGFEGIASLFQPTHSDPLFNWYFNRPVAEEEEGQFNERLRLLEGSSSEPWPGTVRKNAKVLANAGFKPGLDFFVLPYVGRPKTIEQCAANATRNGARGVELWATAKSLAGRVKTSGGEKLLILTGPGDLSFKTSNLVPGQIGELEPLVEEELVEMGFERGTVGPLGVLEGKSTTSNGTRIEYLFDKDFMSRDTRNPEKDVYISGGDPHWSIALDIRKMMIIANGGSNPNRFPANICERGPDSERVFVKHDVTLLSGDSAQTGQAYYGILERSIRSKLQEAGAYFGDDSMRDLDLPSRHRMGRTGAVTTYKDDIIEYINQALHQLPKHPDGTIPTVQRLIAFASNAANLKSITEPISESLKDRSDLKLVTLQDALTEYVEQRKQDSLIVFGLSDVTNDYPDRIGETVIIKGKGKIAEMMQLARNGTGDQLKDAATDLKKTIERAVKTQMADMQGFQGKDKGDFMKREDIEVKGEVLLAGTELWDILESQGWKGGIPDLSGIKLTDPIAVLMEHVAELSLSGSMAT